MEYRILAGDRKTVVERMGQITGEKPLYTRMPRSAYLLRGLAVEKDNTITIGGDADMELLRKLIEEGLVSDGEENMGQEEAAVEHEEPAGEDANPYGSLVIPAEDEAIKPDISFPLANHRPESICNLVFTIYSRGSLLSKSTGGDFYASEELVEKLNAGNGFEESEDAISAIREAGGEALHGIAFEEGKVTFDGFPPADDPALIRAWTALAAAINKNAIRQGHVRARKVDDTNEKFAFRTWLTRLGMNGPDMKEERRLLYRKLSGHTAFRTPEDEKRWKARQAEKRAAQRAAHVEEGNTAGAEG